NSRSLERWTSPTGDVHGGGLWVFTSGTTGSPRATCLSWEALRNSAAGVVEVTGLERGDCWLTPLPLCHVGGVGVVLRCLAAGALAEIWERFEPEALTSRIRSGEITHLSLVPRMLERLLDAASGGFTETALRWVLVGGGAVPPSLVERARRSGIPAVPTYGLTEAASTVTLQRVDEELLGPGDAGWPLPGRRLRILDPGPDGVGEIAVGGSVLADRYWGSTDPGPLVEGGWLATGDFGRLTDDGRLVVADRRSDLIVSGGENVYPAALEARLSQLPGVEEACVVGLPDESWGQQVVAVLRFDSEEEASLEAVQKWCRENLPAWECPRRWEVRIAALPRNRLGKLQRSRLRDELLP
ncbi:MAG: AMP-binding protein, partial [Myxococcota bacterium]|nr:AMP-binding protein [Myxococcota bacterium]